MQLTRTNSNEIIYMGYDNGIMQLQFNDGSLYEYYDVPEEIYTRLWHAPHKRQFLFEYINAHYSYKRL